MSQLERQLQASVDYFSEADRQRHRYPTDEELAEVHVQLSEVATPAWPLPCPTEAGGALPDDEWDDRTEPNMAAWQESLT